MTISDSPNTIDESKIVRNPNLKPVDAPVKTNWSPAGFRALRDAIQQPGVVTIAPWPEAPEYTVTLDLSGIAILSLAGKISNPMLVEKRRAIDNVGKRLESLQDGQSTQEELEDVLHDVSTSVLEYHDYVLGACVIEPKYYMLDQLENGVRPDDGLSIFDFNVEMRWAIMRVLNGGAEEFKNFRADPIGYSLALSEQSAEQDTSGVDATTDDTVVDSELVQSGDLASGNRGRSRKSTRSNAGDEPANEQPADEQTTGDNTTSE